MVLLCLVSDDVLNSISRGALWKSPESGVSGWLAENFGTFQHTIESLSLEDFVIDAHKFLSSADFHGLLEIRVDGKPIYSEPLGIGTNNDVDSGLTMLKEELCKLLPNKSYPGTISIQAQLTNDDFQITMDIHYEQKHGTRNYAVVS